MLVVPNRCCAAPRRMIRSAGTGGSEPGGSQVTLSGKGFATNPLRHFIRGQSQLCQMFDLRL